MKGGGGKPTAVAWGGLYELVGVMKGGGGKFPATAGWRGLELEEGVVLAVTAVFWLDERPFALLLLFLWLVLFFEWLLLLDE